MRRQEQNEGKRYEVVLFDAVQTLIRIEPSVGQVYAEVAARYGVDVEPAGLNRTFKEAWGRIRAAENAQEDLATSDTRERRWWHNLVHEVFGALGVLPAFGDRFEGFFNELYELFAHPNVWYVFDDVEPALCALGQMELRLSVVSNWDTRLHRLLRDLGLRDRFELVLTSAEAGYRKPHPAIFEEALNRLQVPAEKAIHVGDSYEDDIVGAQQVGIEAVIIDRRNAVQSVSYRLRALTDLPARLSTSARE